MRTLESPHEPGRFPSGLLLANARLTVRLHRMFSPLTRLALCALFGLQACVAPPPTGAADGLSIPPPPAEDFNLELRLVLLEDDWRHARAPVYTFEERELVLGPPHFYAVEQVDVVAGHLGTRALEITVAPAHGPPLARWTGDHVGRKLALIAEGEVLVLAKIGEPFPNPFQLNARYDAEQAAALALRLAGTSD